MSVFFKKILVLFVIFHLSVCSTDKTPCQGCKDLVEGIFKGFDITARRNFGGGDVDWEEKRNLKYKTSELRLVEIVETACSKDNFQCHKVLEEHEDDIEHWYFKLQDESSTTLHEFLCLKVAKVCCPNDTFGEECKECPKGNSTQICYGHGTCEGEGDKQGSGKCQCSSGYVGELCNECGRKFYKFFFNDTSVICSPCHHACETCTGGGVTDCESCVSGYKKEADSEDEDVVRCVDINECVEQPDICPDGQYCDNNESSYTCTACHPVCQTCKGGEPSDCEACQVGYKKEADSDGVIRCVDINECVEQEDICPTEQFCANNEGSYTCEEINEESENENKDEL